ncbi:hypothetical protein IAE19_12660 [Acinetobacter sp. S40]|uniref:hypothetical protein n=1 Tax=Acinetobacter sp. S40 TaxID=2767434 RepID=UPI00190C6743|nr:hypothetical protein [Acinetobacter sp. S40]MBJ9986283.1 hypothetical protein [Acinetobacter sp. S40]
MKYDKKISARLILTILGSCMMVKVYAAPLKILDFNQKQLNAVEQRQICQQAKQLCEQPEKWRSLKTPDQKLWLLVKDHIAVFTSSQTGLKLDRQWEIPLVEKNKDVDEQPFIFPKLFLMTQTRYAIAMISPFSEMYSGGGANIERASFYELLDNGKTNRFITDYPFSFSRMIRACFSEQDYEQSKGKCHDEDGLSLDIRPVKPMLWQFRYFYRLEVSPASDSDEKSYKGSRNLNINLNQAPRQPNIPEQWNYAGQG